MVLTSGTFGPCWVSWAPLDWICVKLCELLIIIILVLVTKYNWLIDWDYSLRFDNGYKVIFVFWCNSTRRNFPRLLLIGPISILDPHRTHIDSIRWSWAIILCWIQVLFKGPLSLIAVSYLPMSTTVPLASPLRANLCGNLNNPLPHVHLLSTAEEINSDLLADVCHNHLQLYYLRCFGCNKLHVSCSVAQVSLACTIADEIE